MHSVLYGLNPFIIQKTFTCIMIERLTSEQIKLFVYQQGAEFVGVVAADTFPSSTPLRPPQRLLAGAKSVIVYGIPIILGSISGTSEIATAHTKTVYDELDRIGYKISRFLEQSGYRAVTVPSFWPLEMTKETKGLVGDLSLKHAAVAAGLGVWGRSRLVINPMWGPRVRFGAVVSETPLCSDLPLECEFCTDCDVCIEACPVGALSLDMTVETRKCLQHFLQYGLPGLSRFLLDIIGKPSDKQLTSLRDPLFWNLYQYSAVGLSYNCSRCLEVCPIGQERYKQKKEGND
jgi:epoxyqueuosine reductase QueG